MIPSVMGAITANKTFLITAHENPDGDAVGSSLALANYLRNSGKDVAVYFPDPVPDNYNFLSLADTVLNYIPDRYFDICFVLDCGDILRSGETVTASNKFGKIINVDHHPDNKKFGDINLIDSAASATGALVYRIVKASGCEIDYSTALCIYTSIVSDTGSFRYSNADTEAFSISGEMVSLGVNPWFVAEKLYESQPCKRLELLALALSTLHLVDRGNVASITVTLEMLAKTSATSDLTDGFVNYPRSIRGVEVAIFFREIETGVYKVGFRSKGKVNVSALAAAFGGGGHHNAAGCKISGSIEEAKATIFTYLETVL
ncbi:MAG: bifunctional oligoribonuclease/PAP phosphatase NrnA [Deltaproteobacteria bacterium]